MKVKKYQFPAEMHGKASANMMHYFAAIGPASDKDTTPGRTSTSSTALNTGSVSIAPATSPIGPTSGSTSPSAPTGTSSTVSPNPTGAGTTAPIGDAGKGADAPLTGGSTAINTTYVTQTYDTTRPLPLVPVVLAVTDATTSLGGGGGGGFGGGGGMPSGEEDKKDAVAPKKKHIFPWLLIATGVFMIVKQPLK